MRRWHIMIISPNKSMGFYFNELQVQLFVFIVQASFIFPWKMSKKMAGGARNVLSHISRDE